MVIDLTSYEVRIIIEALGARALVYDDEDTIVEASQLIAKLIGPDVPAYNDEPDWGGLGGPPPSNDCPGDSRWL